ncbi:hypothetical protein WN51_08637 [Melipona quadrifasciata]|uniref:Uncharacterized protein n=1 Tax=Melipona quadrifasciata TaxID=166423 RepID=A0A0N1IU09_9HYME|nr:hypothetical protein WN51_08637 [Melipona quadrifasciata]
MPSFCKQHLHLCSLTLLESCRGHNPDCKHSHDVDPGYSIGRALRQSSKASHEPDHRQHPLSNPSRGKDVTRVTVTQKYPFLVIVLQVAHMYLLRNLSSKFTVLCQIRVKNINNFYSVIYRRIQKEDELLYTVWSLVMVREPVTNARDGTVQGPEKPRYVARNSGNEKFGELSPEKVQPHSKKIKNLSQFTETCKRRDGSVAKETGRKFASERIKALGSSIIFSEASSSSVLISGNSDKKTLKKQYTTKRLAIKRNFYFGWWFCRSLELIFVYPNLLLGVLDRKECKLQPFF